MERNATKDRQLVTVLLIVVVVIIIIAVITMTVAMFGEHGICSQSMTKRIFTVKTASQGDVKRQRIPKIIMQTNSSCEVPLKMHETIETIVTINPEYSYFYFDNDAARSFLEREYGHRLLSAYDDLIPGAFKADLFRYCFLYRHGGVYVDTGMTCLKPFRELIREDDEFVAPEDNGNGVSVYNAFICCTPRHPIIGKAILLSFKNIERCDKTDEMLNMTGPGVLGKAFKEITGHDSTLHPNKDYGNGCRLLRHIGGNKLHRDPHNIVGEIDQDAVVFLKTKYPEYYNDRKWYHKTEHYGVLWNKNEVFKSVVQGKLQSSECESEKVPCKEEQILRPVVQYRCAMRTTKTQRIPKIIMQTNELDKVPRGMFDAMKTIMDDNDEYEYFYYDARSRRKFIKKHFERRVLAAYDRLVPGAFKADLFRYCFLYQKGGVYIDSGMISVQPLRTVIDCDDDLIIPEDDGRERMCNGFICSIAQHPVFKMAISRIVFNVETNYYGGSALDVTGPNLMGEMFQKVYGRKVRELYFCGEGVKVLRYSSSLTLTGNNCPSTGKIFYAGVTILETKYPDYYKDRKWYLPGEQYDTYWQLRQMYG